MQLHTLTSFLATLAPLSLQESYDNSGLLVGSPGMEIHKALICLDVTDEIMKEAIDTGCNLVIAHHPVIFGGLKRLNGANMTERIVMQAVKHDIALYAIHTNLDNVPHGVNLRICQTLGIKNPKILDPKKGILRKLVTYCPDTVLDNGLPVVDAVREAIWAAGAGHIGNYDQCSFLTEGLGSYRPLEGSHPYLGSTGELAREKEIRVEAVFPAHLQSKVIEALKSVHPYEEVAYDIIALENELSTVGAGMIGELEAEMDEMAFLQHVKNVMQAGCVRYTALLGKKVKRVAVCGGSGSFLLGQAIKQGADVFVTADFKYHQFFEADNKIVIADIGHYESEQYTIGLIFDALIENFPNFALLKSGVNTNPVNYI